MTAAPVALLDACVLIPPRLRDVLLSVADEDVFDPLWSEVIQHEVRAKIEHNHPGQGAVIDRMFARMTAEFEGGLVQGWHARTVGLMTPDPNDRHVLAAAITGNADVIVTANLKDFPDYCLPPGIEVKHPDRFLSDMLSARPDGVFAALEKCAERVDRDVRSVLENLSRHHAPEFAAAARKMIENRD
jgi:predicted nucleic acid-binding protein